MLISICIPCYRSMETLPIVVDNIKKEFAKHDNHDYQIVLVNDGSPDATFETIRNLCKEDEKIIGVDLTRNYGQAAAKIAALQYYTGDVVVFMDDDGQHSADGIFKLVDKLDEGYDVVYAHFESKKHSLFKRFTSFLHNWLAEQMGNKPKGVHRSSFVAWSKVVADSVKEYKSPFVSIGSYLVHITSKFSEVDMEHKERLTGNSRYTLKKLVKMWLNIFISFSMVPLRMASYLGFFFAISGMIAGLYLVIRKIIRPTIVAGYTSNMVMILLIGGIIMIILGIMGEYVGRIYMTISGMPQYSIRQSLNTNKDEQERG